MINALILSSVLMVHGLSCAKDKGTPVQTTPKDSTQITIVNNGFETGGATQTPTGWNVLADGSNADACFIQAGGYQSKFSLTHKKTVAYKVFTSQALSGLSTGYYSLYAWVKNGGGQNSCYISARDYGDMERMTSLPVTNEWTRVVIRGIHVNNGKCTIGIYSDANANNWCMVDEFQMIKDDKPYTFLKGGDISELSYIESMGGKFYDNGVEKNCLQILKDNGFNIVRLRLYNDPGNPGFSPSKRLPAGFQNPTDVLNMAKRAKDMGFQIQLTFYYSDYWSNVKAHDFENLSFTDLKTAVYNFTYDFMNKMKNQGTAPEYVSLGNEMQVGLLLPDGSSKNFPQLAELLKQGYNAVKAVSFSSKVILHLDDAGNSGKYDWFFGECDKNGVQYDVIGASYYPFWTKKTVTQIREWANDESAKFNKDIMIMETGYNWNPTLPSGNNGQLSNNGPYDNIYPSSPKGQLDFLYECFNGLKNVENGRVIGDLYWDPVMIEVPGVGWELGAPNVVSNTTLFDFKGNALPVFKAFKFNN